MPGVTLDIHCFLCLENMGTKCHPDFDHTQFYTTLIHEGIVYTSEILNSLAIKGYGGSTQTLRSIIEDKNKNLTTGGIGFRKIEPVCLTQEQKSELVDLGLDLSGRHQHRRTIECANGSITKKIISNDIHLY